MARLHKFTLALLLLPALLSSCGNGNPDEGPIVRDTTITPVNAFNNLFFDSLKLEEAIGADSNLAAFGEPLRRFYAGRNYQFAWFDTGGLAEQAINFRNMWSAYAANQQDSSLLNPDLADVIDSLIHPGIRAPKSKNFLFNTEMALTLQFFNYTQTAFTGSNKLNMDELAWFIPRKKVEPAEILDSLIASKGRDIDRYAPVNNQYYLLEDYLKKYYKLEKETGWNEIVADKKKYSPGDSSETIALIKKRLGQLGDYTDSDTSGIFTPELKEAVKNYQRRHGIDEDGVIGKQFLARLNLPIHQRIRQILINQERMRWVPKSPETDYLLVNIPEFRLHVYEAGKPAFDMDVVVGQAQNSTVIFTGTLKYVVFAPYWNIPPGILDGEILPAVRKDPHYLAGHDMEVVDKNQNVIPENTIDWNSYTSKNFPYMIRQRPGPNNSLGRVKFLFPNNYNIYFHDTPAKSLFGETRRDFSHGCIRLSEPVKFAEYLLRNDTAWNKERIDTTLLSTKEKYVTLKEPVPVFIGYFTAWVDRDGQLNFRDDIYGHDRKLEEKLFSSIR